jgi:hypothetical protein
MNAIEHATSIEIATKIATVVNLFQWRFPGLTADLAPWLDNVETRKFDDRNSLDLSFSFPERHLYCQCQNILLQIFLPTDARSLTIEMTGHDYLGLRWRFIHGDRAEFMGVSLPILDGKKRLREVCALTQVIFQ